MKLLDTLSEKRVLILGLGREGVSSLLFLRRLFPQKRLGLADKTTWEQLDEQTRQLIESDSNVALFLGKDYLSSISKYEVIFKSPGIHPSELTGVKQNDIILTSNTEVFFECCPGTIIGVTGTKGKSTTTSLIYEVLKAAAVDARLTGNIGIAPLSSLDNATSASIFVTELSSYQLADLHKSPHIAVIQNVVPEHLDYHGDFEAYVSAKQNIARYQTEKDYILFNAAYPIPTHIAETSKAQKIPFGFSQIGSIGSFADNTSLTFYQDGHQEEIMLIETVPLRGTFNLQNVMPSIIVGKILGIPTETIAAGIQNFHSLEHRLEFVDTINEVSFYNDSLSTIPEAAISAIQAFPNKQLILLAGGYDRGLDFTELAQVILTNEVKAVLLFPTTGAKIWQAIAGQAREGEKIPQYRFVTDMADAVTQAFSLATKRDIVLLSPASPSFSSFKDYRDRGLQFKTAVSKLISILNRS